MSKSPILLKWEAKVGPINNEELAQLLENGIDLKEDIDNSPKSSYFVEKAEKSLYAQEFI